MAEVTQGDWKSISGNPNFWTRLRIVYSGSTANGYLQIRRDSGSYSPYQSVGQINCGGSHWATKTGVSIGPMTIDTTWRDYIWLGQFSINPAVATVVNAWANCDSTNPDHVRFKYNADNYFSGVTIPAQIVAPSGLSATLNSRTWNSANITGAISSWGGASSGSFILGVLSSSVTSWTGGRQENISQGYTGLSRTGTVDNNSAAVGGGFTLRGCKAFKIGMWADNLTANASMVNSTVYYLPPSPMAALSVTSQTGSATANSVTINFSTTGGNSTNNENVNVTTQFRYSTNAGSTWSAWANVGSDATPWTARTGSFTVPYGTATLLQTRQVYQGQVSESKQISFTSTSCTAPTFTSAVGTPTAYNAVSVTGTVASYGKPVIAASARIDVGLTASSSSIANRRESWTTGGTYPLTRTVTINNSTALTGSLNLVGCMTVYPFVQAYNGLCDGIVKIGSGVTTPPAPLTSVSHTITLAADDTYTSNISVVGSTANNVSGATVYYEYRYSVDSGTMSAWTLASPNRITVAGTNWNITSLPAGSHITVDVRTYQTSGNYSNTYSYSFDTPLPEPTVNLQWNGTRDTLSINATSAVVADFEISYSYDGDSYQPLVTQSNVGSVAYDFAYPNHGNGETLTIRARNKKTGTAVWSAYEYKSTVVPNPIIGVIRYSDGSQKYIVDIREKKANGTLTPAWQNGQRVVKNNQ